MWTRFAPLGSASACLRGWNGLGTGGRLRSAQCGRACPEVSTIDACRGPATTLVRFRRTAEAGNSWILWISKRFSSRRYGTLCFKDDGNGHPRLPRGAEGESAEELARRLRLLWVLDEVRQGRMTRIRATHLVGLGLEEFLWLQSNHGLDALDYELEDFRSELAGAP